MGRENLKLITLISLIVITSLTATYAYIELADSTTATSGQAGCFAVNYSGQVIDGATIQSTTNYTEGTYSEVTLSKNEECELYTEAEIRIHTYDTTTAPITGEKKALKYKIEKISGDGEILSGGEGFINQIGDITIATVSLTEVDTVYRIYIWIDSAISQGSYDNKTYSGYIYATSAQSSTITDETENEDPSEDEDVIFDGTNNVPNLDNGNLIPVYFDDTVGTYGSWMKADSNNSNNSWYDYANKKWANAVIIADSSKKATYQNATPGTPIADADITAFYVWIPRYKYRVWNINRQGQAEDYYSYEAYSKGIQIEFENGTASTGNVTCSYNDQIDITATTLADNCSVNGTAVSYNTSNLTYGESNPAWYTHPAFNFGGTPKTGFWIGKFETSGTANSTTNIVDTPTILPDVQSITEQTVSEQFMSSKNFQSYLTNSTLDAHMLTNLEWGAVAYLSHSIYGLCNENSCTGMNFNNSSSYYTGRSLGAIAASSSSSTYGTYNYKGYTLSGNTPTGSPDITKVASTTKNITGVYDMSGGAYDYVMGNMVSSSKVFYPSSAGDAWNNTEWWDSTNNRLHTKYYNSYAYGTNYYKAIAFNRARLGDATAEVLGGTSTASAWKIGSGITGSYSGFVYSSNSWFSRGGRSSNTRSGAFYFSNSNGNSSSSYSFRSSLS